MFIGLIKNTGIVEQIDLELILKISSDLAAEIKIESHLAIDGRVLRVSLKNFWKKYLSFSPIIN